MEGNRNDNVNDSIINASIDSSTNILPIDNTPESQDDLYEGDIESNISISSDSIVNEDDYTIVNEFTTSIINKNGHHNNLYSPISNVSSDMYSYLSTSTNVSYENKKGARRINDSLDRIKSLKQVGNENNVHKWPKNTVLVASDSMLSKLDERRLCKNNFNMKVRSFNGSTVEDMYFYLYPLLKKEREYLILHVGTNDCANNTSERVLNNIISLKQHIEKNDQGIKVIISIPVARFD